MIDATPHPKHTGGPEAVGRTMAQAPDVDGVVHIDGRLPDGTGVGDVITVTIDAVVGYDLVGTCGES
jgi:ribosomal protein S12 methylthiotransferase